MSSDDLRRIESFLSRQELGVQASVGAAGAPQAAVVGIVSDGLEVFFDTSVGSRKAQNLRREPRVALVVGWDEECTLQIDGVADQPTGEALARWKSLYFARFPDGRTRERWPDIGYFRVRPLWLRFSDFRPDPPRIVELTPPA